MRGWIGVLTLGVGCTERLAPEKGDPAGGARGSEAYDVVVVGSTTGGVAAAVQAGRLGASVLLVDDHDYVGGQASAGGVPTMDDVGGVMQDEIGGIFLELVDLLEDEYDGRPVDTCYGYGTRNRCYEPSKVRDALQQLLDEAGVVVWQHSVAVALNMDGIEVQGVQIQRGEGWIESVDAGVVVDGTEYGDLLPLAGAGYRVGTTDSIEQNLSAHVQNTTWVAVIKKYPNGSPMPETQALPGYEESVANFRHWVPVAFYPPDDEHDGNNLVWDFATEMMYRGLPDSTNPDFYRWYDEDRITKSCLNHANDYPSSRTPPGRVDPGLLRADHLFDPAVRRQNLCNAKVRTLNYLHYLRTELGFSSWSIADDEGYDTETDLCVDEIPEALRPLERAMAEVPYVRESRRAIGEFTLTQAENRRSGPDTFIPNWPTGHDHYDTAAGIAMYGVDLAHGCMTNRCLELDLDSINDRSPPWHVGGAYQLPLDVQLPEIVENLVMADKNFSASRQILGGHRTQPGTLSVGQAAGALAAIAADAGIHPRDVHPIEVQRALLNEPVHPAALSLWWFSDVPPTDPRWPSVQLVSLRDVIRGSNHLFSIDTETTRASLARITTNLFHLPLGECTGEVFDDVDENTIFCDSIEAAGLAGLIDPAFENDYGPDDVAQLSTLNVAIHRGFGLGDPQTDPVDLPLTPGIAATTIDPWLDQVPTGVLIEVERVIAQPTISASWTQSYATTPIIDYEVAVGTTPGDDDAVGWASVGTVRAFVVDLSNPVEGQPYYVSVRAHGRNGVSSATRSSRSVTWEADPPYHVDAAIEKVDGGGVRLLGQAWAESGVASVTYQVDGGLPQHAKVADALGDSSYWVELDGLANGPHTATITAGDAAGNPAECAISWTEPALLLVSSPAQCDLVSADQPTTITADADPSVPYVTFKVDGQVVGVDFTAPFGIDWIPSNRAIQHTIQAVAFPYDAASHSITVTTDGEAPTLAVPPQTFPTSAPGLLRIDAADDHGLREVDLFIQPLAGTVPRIPLPAAPSANAQLALADLDGDKQSDFVWHQPNGTLTVTPWNPRCPGGCTPAPEPIAVGPCGSTVGWVLAGSADFDRDLRTDLVWYHPTTGVAKIWHMARKTCLNAVDVADPMPGFALVGAGDLSGDFEVDLLWRKGQTLADEEIVVQLLEDTTSIAAVDIEPGLDHTGWAIGALADIDGDESLDLVWHHASGGHVVAWLMRGWAHVAAPLPPADAGWVLTDAGELDSDVQFPATELLWRDATTGVNHWKTKRAGMLERDFDPPYAFWTQVATGTVITARAVDLVGHATETTFVVP